MPATFTSMRYVSYRYWPVASLIASAGVWLQRIVQDWYVLTVLADHDASQAGLAATLQFLPIILFSAWARVLADHIPGRRLLQCMQVDVGLMPFIISIVVLAGTGGLWRQYILVFISGTISTVDTPTRQASVGELVPREKMANAVALNATTFRTAHLIGPASAGFFIDWWGIGPVFLIDAVMFMAPVIALAFMRGDQLYPRTLMSSALGQLRESVTYVHNRTDIRIILALIFVVSALDMNFQMANALIATTVFEKAAGSFSILSAFMMVGSILGSMGAARRAPRLRIILISAVFYGTAGILPALSPSYWWFTLLSIPTGFGILTMNASASALVQARTDPDKRGRVMALYSLVLLGATPIGSPLIGWVGTTSGAHWSILVDSVASLSIALICGAWAMIHWKGRVVRRHSLP